MFHSIQEIHLTSKEMQQNRGPKLYTKKVYIHVYKYLRKQHLNLGKFNYYLVLVFSSSDSPIPQPNEEYYASN